MTYEKSVLYTRGSLSSGAVSVSLNDSWTGRQILQTLGTFPPRRLSPEELDVSDNVQHFGSVLNQYRLNCLIELYEITARASWLNQALS